MKQKQWKKEEWKGKGGKGGMEGRQNVVEQKGREEWKGDRML